MKIIKLICKKLSKSQPEQIKKTLPRDTRMKLQKNNDKEKILKASKGGKMRYVQKNKE